MENVLQAQHEAHKANTVWLNVYIREAHTKSRWPVPGQEILVEQTTSLEERLDLATRFHEAHPCPWPTVVDDTTDAADLAYDASPEKLIVIIDGRVAFTSGQGPFQYVPEELGAYLHGLLGGGDSR